MSNEKINFEKLADGLTDEQKKDMVKSTITEKQAEGSIAREERLTGMEKNNIDLTSFSEKKSESTRVFLEGMIDGHSIEIQRIVPHDKTKKAPIVGALDQKLLTREQAEALFNKYIEYSKNSPEDIHKDDEMIEEVISYQKNIEETIKRGDEKKRREDEEETLNKTVDDLLKK